MARDGRDGVAPPPRGLLLSGLKELPWVGEICEGLLEERLRRRTVKEALAGS